MLLVIVAGAMVTCSCPSLEHSTPPEVDILPGGPVVKVTSDAQALDRALLFTRESKLDWGQPTGLYRTVSKWYAIQFPDGPQGQSRIVLVNPENGQAELPLKKL